jgi:hypothetical protein
MTRVGPKRQKSKMFKRNWNVTLFAPPNQLALIELPAEYLFSNRTDMNY